VTIINNKYQGRLPFLNDNEEVAVILRVAPAKYKSVLATAQVTHKGGLTPSHLYDAMKSYYRILKDQDEEDDGEGKEVEEVLMSTIGKLKDKKKVKELLSIMAQQLQQSSRFRGKCENCGKIGHKSEQCWAKQENAHMRPHWHKHPNEAGNVSINRGPEILMTAVDETDEKMEPIEAKETLEDMHEDDSNYDDEDEFYDCYATEEEVWRYVSNEATMAKGNQIEMDEHIDDYEAGESIGPRASSIDDESIGMRTIGLRTSSIDDETCDDGEIDDEARDDGEHDDETRDEDATGDQHFTGTKEMEIEQRVKIVNDSKIDTENENQRINIEVGESDKMRTSTYDSHDENFEENREEEDHKNKANYTTMNHEEKGAPRRIERTNETTELKETDLQQVKYKKKRTLEMMNTTLIRKEMRTSKVSRGECWKLKLLQKSNESNEHRRNRKKTFTEKLYRNLFNTRMSRILRETGRER